MKIQSSQFELRIILDTLYPLFFAQHNSQNQALVVKTPPTFPHEQQGGVLSI